MASLKGTQTEKNLLIAFAVILIMMFGMYFAYGNHLKKKWGKK